MYALVALDGSPMSEEVLAPVTQLVAELAPSEKKTLHLIHVVELPLTYGRIGMSQYVNQMKEEAKRQDGTGSEGAHVAGHVSDTKPIT